MQAIDSSWEVQQGDKVHREFVRLAFKKQASFKWRNLVTKIKKKKTPYIRGKSKTLRKEFLWKSPSLMGALILNTFWGVCVCVGGDFLGILNHEK